MTRLIRAATTSAALARRRLRVHLWPILQTALAAVGAWYVAMVAGVEHQPVFASIAAVISLGATFGQRRTKAVQLIFGVVMGIVVADLIVRAIGTGMFQIGVLVLLAMTIAVMLGAGELVVVESAVSAMLLASVAQSGGETRLLEALIGGGVALAVHALVFPPKPLLGAARATNALFGDLGAVMRDIANALAAGDTVRATNALGAARALGETLRELEEALALGTETARWAPMRRATLAELERYAGTVEHADSAIRHTRVLAERVRSHVRAGRPAPSGLPDAIRRLGTAAWEVPAQFDEPWRSGDVLRAALGAAADATSAVAGLGDPALTEIAGQIRSASMDVLRASEAAEGASGTLVDAPTEELLAAT